MKAQQEPSQEKSMIEQNIKEFLAAARSYLFTLLPAQTAQLAHIQVSQKR